MVLHTNPRASSKKELIIIGETADHSSYNGMCMYAREPGPRADDLQEPTECLCFSTVGRIISNVA